jgi:hypothetical protein
VSKGRWGAADEGVEALRSLAMATKSPHFGARIERCIFTGVARFAHTSLFSGANNFTDLTGDPLISRVLGFSEAEIRATFPAELSRLARGLGTDADGAVQQLAFWFNGYCFDGTSTCFNPFPVLSSLNAGCIMGRETAGGASSTDLFGLSPGALVRSLVGELQRGATVGAAAAASYDTVDPERRRVRAVPLLLQTGLLSRVPGKPLDCRPPNEYASAALRRMFVEAMDDDKGGDGEALALSALNTALALRSPAALAEASQGHSAAPAPASPVQPRDKTKVLDGNN